MTAGKKSEKQSFFHRGGILMYPRLIICQQNVKVNVIKKEY